MPRRGLFAAAVFLLAALAYLVWPGSVGEHPRGSQPGGTEQAGSPTDEMGVGKSSADDGLAPEQVTRESGEPPDGASPSAEEPIDRNRDLHGHVFLQESGGFAGAEVRVWRPMRQGDRMLDLTRGKNRELVASTTTNADGDFRVPVEPGSVYDLDVYAEGFIAPLRRGCAAGERVILRLEEAASVSGTVTADATGHPVAGVPVRVARPGDLGRVFETVTDADGQYQVSTLVAGLWRISLIPEDLQPPAWTTLSLQEGEHLVQDFALAAGRVVRGQVLDATTGHPIPGAEICSGWTFSRSVFADAQGQYELRGLRGGDLRLSARASGYGMLSIVHGNAEGMSTCDIELLPARVAVGRVFLPDGEPAEGVYVAATASMRRDGTQQTDWQTTRSGADGRFELRDLRADVPHTLVLELRGFGTAYYEFPASEAQEPELLLGDFILSHGAWISGTVACAQNYKANMQVVLRGWNQDRDRFGRGPEPGLATYLGQVETRTDDLGRFRFSNLAPGTYTVSVRRTAVEQELPDPIVVYAGQGVEGIHFPLPPSSQIGGIVLGLDGEPVTDAYVTIRSESGDAGYGSTIRVDGSGRFTFRQLAEGTYQLKAILPPQTGEVGSRPRVEGVLAGVQTGDMDLRLRMHLVSSISGTVVDAEGRPVAGAHVRALAPTGERLVGTTTRADGFFYLELPKDSLATVVAVPPIKQVTAGGTEVWIVPDHHPAEARQESVAAGRSA